MIFSDLDGSLHDSQHGFHPQDLQTLQALPQQRILRTIATGRSLYSAQQVLAADFPIDYLIFSSGAGVMHWPTQSLIHKSHLSTEDITYLLGFFSSYRLDFFLHGEVPNNHYFWCHRFSAQNDDFEARRLLYAGLSTALPPAFLQWQPTSLCSQAIIFVSPEATDFYHALLCEHLPHLSIIRSTSPLDGKSGWLEIFPAHVSKSQAAQWLRHELESHHGLSMAFGNDYNDTDLLAWADKGFVVKSAPESLKVHHTEVSDPRDAGFSEAFAHWQQSFNQANSGP